MENNTNNLNENQNSNNVETNAVENKKKNFSIAALVLGIVAFLYMVYINTLCNFGYNIWGTRIKIIKKRNVCSRNYNRCDRYGTFYIINCISFSIRFRYFEKCNR